MRRQHPWSWAIVGLAMIAIVITGYFAVTRTAARAAQPARAVLVIGTNPPFPPFEQRYGGTIEGFDIDLVARIAKQMNRRLKIQEFTDFSSILPALAAGKIDLAVSAITITPQRSEVVTFSQSYYTTAQAVLATKQSILRNLSQPADFAGLKVAYQKGTTSEDWAKKHLLDSVKVAACTTFDDLDYALQSLRFGEFDVVLLDKAPAEKFVQNHPDLKMVGTIETGEQYGLAVQRGDPQHLLPTINNVLETMHKKGEDQALWNKWFGGAR